MEELRDKDQMSVSAESIKWWSHYASEHKFETEEDARKWIARKAMLGDKAMSREKTPEEYAEYAKEIPLYQSGKSWKIGKRIRIDKRLKMSDIEVRKPSRETLSNVANANGESGWKIVAPFIVKIYDLIPADEDDFLYKRGNEPERMQNLAAKIRENLWIETPIVGILNKEFWLIEGQHRVRAMAILGFKTIPVIGIEYEG